MKGFSIYTSFGKKGFGFKKDEKSIYLSLGLCVICFTKTDIEAVLRSLLSELREKDQRENDLLRLEQKVLSSNEEYIDRQNEIKDKMLNLNETIDELQGKLKSNKDNNVEYKSHIAELEHEIAILEDVSDENDDLKDEVKMLETELKQEKFNSSVLEEYFLNPS